NVRFEDNQRFASQMHKLSRTNDHPNGDRSLPQMLMKRLPLLAVLIASPAIGQTTNDPFPEPIVAEEGVIRVNFVEFATVPDIDGSAARMMTMLTEPGTRRMFVSDMRGPIYSV